MAFYGGSSDRRGWNPRPGWGRDWREGVVGGGAAHQHQGGQAPGGWGPVHCRTHHDTHMRQEKDYFGLFGSDDKTNGVQRSPDPHFFPNFSQPPPLPEKIGLFPDFSQPPPLTDNLEAQEKEGASTSSGSQRKRCRGGFDAEEESVPTKKPKLSDSKYLLSFKGFLETQGDYITEEESLAMYREYKTEYRRRRMLEFFSAHKEEEWMMEMYHPVCKERRLLEEQARVARRADVFWSIFKNEELRGMGLEAGQEEEKLIRMMDNFVSRLENAEKEVKSGKNVVKSEPLPNLDEAVDHNENLVEDDEDNLEKLFHHPVSVFLPRVPLSVPISLVEQLGRQCQGFQRAVLAPVKFQAGNEQHMRKAWITYDADTNIKQV